MNYIVKKDLGQSLPSRIINFPELYKDDFVEPEKNAPIVATAFQQIDSNGEVVNEVTRRVAPKNGSGFVLSYTAKMCEFLEKVSTSSIVRVFLYIAHHQDYGNNGHRFGYCCTRKHLYAVLGIDRKSLYSALSYLEKNFLVHVGVVAGLTEFMVNPTYITIGTDRKARMAEWNRRWAETFAKKNVK